MTVKVFVGKDVEGKPWAFDTHHEEWAAKRILRIVYQHFHHKAVTVVVAANLHEPAADLVFLTDRGIGVLELKHYSGHISIDADGNWRADSTLIEPNGDPHGQVSGHKSEIRRKIRSQLPKALQTIDIKVQSAVCITSPTPVTIQSINDLDGMVQERYGSQFKLFALTEQRVIDWVDSIRFDEDVKGRERKAPIYIESQLRERWTKQQLGAVEWKEFEEQLADVEPYAYILIKRNGEVLGTYNFTRDVVTVGRSFTSDIDIPEEYKLVSRQHARIERDTLGVWIEDKSKRGTFFGVKTPRIESRLALRDGQQIMLGGSNENDKRVCIVEFRLVRPLPFPPENGNETA